MTTNRKPSHEAYAFNREGKRAVALRSMVNITGEGGASRTTWVHVAPFGRWEGHASGPFELTQADFESCVADTERRVTPQSVDYEHASINPEGDATPAAGWVQKLEIHNDGLYALVEFTERAAKMIKGGEYRFSSGVFFWNVPDRVTGENLPCVLDTIALTNRPFIDGQHPIMLTRSARTLTQSTGAPMQITREDLDKALDALNSESLTPDQIKAIVEGLAKLAEASKPAEPEKPAAETVEVEAEKSEEVELAAPVEGEPEPLPEAMPAMDLAGLMAKLGEATGLDEAALLAALEANLDALAGMLKGSPEAAPGVDLTVRALSENLANVRSRLQKYEAAERKAAEDKIDAEVDSLIKSGKLHPSKRIEVRSLAIKQPAAFRTLSNALVPAYPVGKHAGSPPASESQSLADTVIDDKDPRVIALNTSMDRMGVKDPEVRKTRILAALKVKA